MAQEASAPLELEALAAIGEAVLMHARGRPGLVKNIFRAAFKFTASIATHKTLSHICEDVAENANWTLPRSIGHKIRGRRSMDAFVDDFIAALGREDKD